MGAARVQPDMDAIRREADGMRLRRFSTAGVPGAMGDAGRRQAIVELITRSAQPRGDQPLGIERSQVDVNFGQEFGKSFTFSWTSMPNSPRRYGCLERVRTESPPGEEDRE